MTREQIQAGYITWLIDHMSHDELVQFFVDHTNEDLNDLDDIECIEEIQHYMGPDYTLMCDSAPVLSY